MVQEPSFILDEKGDYMCLDTARIIVGEELDLLLTIMNSKLFFYSIKTFYGGGGLGETGVRMKHTFFENFPMPKLNESQKNQLRQLLIEPILKSSEINTIIYSAYNFDNEEIGFIEFQ